MTYVAIIQSICVIAASLAAIIGINTWRREIRAKMRVDLAMEVLPLFYEARDAVDAIRSPLGHEAELRAVQQQASRNGLDKRPPNFCDVVSYRCQQARGVFSRLHSLRYRASALFGKESMKPFDEIISVRRKILISARHLPELLEQREKKRLCAPNTRDEWLEKKIHELEDVVEETGRSDPIGPRVEGAIADVEAICIPILNPAPPLKHIRQIVNRLWSLAKRLTG